LEAFEMLAVKINNVAPQMQTSTLIFTIVIAIVRFHPGTFLPRVLFDVGSVFPKASSSRNAAAL
jgi:hypothetical protein